LLSPCAAGTGIFVYIKCVHGEVRRYFRRYVEMAKEKKAQIIDELQATFSKCNVGILTDYRGLSTAEIDDLRRKLKESGIEYRVVKNTLARFAARKAGMSELTDSFEGPVAVAFGYGEIPEPARVLVEYIQATKSTLGIKGGFLSDRLLTSGDVETLATWPTREILIGQVMAGIQSPIAGLVNVLAGPIRGIMSVLQARVQQLEGA
jgi:large subunit ribosomal protein L10